MSNNVNVVSGVISFTRVLDGDLITTHLYSTKLLIQRLKEGGDTPLPDWTIADNQPTIYPRILSPLPNCALLKCIIPKGAYYFEGYFDDSPSYASSQIKILEEI